MNLIKAQYEFHLHNDLFSYVSISNPTWSENVCRLSTHSGSTPVTPVRRRDDSSLTLICKESFCVTEKSLWSSISTRPVVMNIFSLYPDDKSAWLHYDCDKKEKRLTVFFRFSSQARQLWADQVCRCRAWTRVCVCSCKFSRALSVWVGSGRACCLADMIYLFMVYLIFWMIPQQSSKWQW